jgi:hypothetical protein
MQDSKPRTAEEAWAFVSRVEAFFMPWDIDGLLAGFTDDCLVRFGGISEFRGKAPLERLFPCAQRAAEGLSAAQRASCADGRHNR